MTSIVIQEPFVPDILESALLITQAAQAHRVAALYRWPTSRVAPSAGGYIDLGASSLLTERERTQQLVQEIKTLQEGWDGFGASPIPQEICDIALSLIDSLPISVGMPDISPNPNGTISLEWENALGIMHLELGKTRYSLYAQFRFGGVIHRNGTLAELPSTITESINEMFPVADPQDYTLSSVHYTQAAA